MVAIALLGAGCGSDDGDGDNAGASTGEKRKVSAQLFGRAVPFFAGVSRGMTDGAETHNFDFKISWSGLNPQEQLDQVETLMTQQPDGLFFAPLDPKTVEPALLQAQKNGTKVITISGAVSDPEAYTAAVGPNFADMGKKKAEAIVEELGGKGKVALVNGPHGLPFVEDQLKAAKEVFSANPGIEIVNELFTTEVTVDQGLDATQNVLTKNSDVAAIFYSGDDQAVGGIQAVDERNIPQDKIFLAATDGNDPGVKAVQSGKLDYTLAECPYQLGMIADETMAKAIEGEPVEKFVYTPVIPLTPDTIEDTLASAEWPKCTGK